LLTEFKEIRVGGKVKPLKRIDVGYLTLQDLERLKRKFSQYRVSKKEREKNSLNVANDFILFKR
jgi:hypothetical protein